MRIQNVVRPVVIGVGLVVGLTASVVGLTTSASAQDAAAEGRGEEVFKKCRACHRVGDGATNLVGPVLNGVIGRKAGTVEGFKYSDINKASGEAGLVWTDALILTYLEEPNTFLKKFLTDKGKASEAEGTTKMAFKLADEADRKDVIAYLKKFSPAK
jgi:cytochrome c